MKLAAIIAEYNPFHLGHAQQIQTIRSHLGPDTVIVVLLSGNWTQRGEPALQTKGDRAEAAIAGGADLILELPSIFSCAAAPIFADGAIQLLLDTGLRMTLCFGSETPDYRCLHAVADLLLEEETWSEALKQNLHKGLSFPQARAQALTNKLVQLPLSPPRFYTASGNLSASGDTTWIAPSAPVSCSESNTTVSESWLTLLRQPNALLGIEYLRACKKRDRKHQLSFLTLPRFGNAEQAPMASIQPFNAETCNLEQLKPEYFYSATQIRTLLRREEDPRKWIELLARSVPSHSGALLFRDKQKNQLLFPDTFWPTVYNAVRSRSKTELSQLEGWSEAQAKRALNLLQTTPAAIASYQGFLQAMSHRSLTIARVRRNLYAALFNLTQDRAQQIRGKGPAYLRPLAYSRKGKYVLKQLRKSCSLPNISQVSDFHKWNPEHPVALQGNFELQLGMFRTLILGGDPLTEYHQHTQLHRF